MNKFNLSLISGVIGLVTGSVALYNGMTIFPNIMKKEISVLDTKQALNIIEQIKRNPDFKDLNITGIAQSSEPGFYVVKTPKFSFYYNAISNTVFNGEVFDASTGNSTKNAMLNIIDSKISLSPEKYRLGTLENSDAKQEIKAATKNKAVIVNDSSTLELKNKVEESEASKTKNDATDLAQYHKSLTKSFDIPVKRNAASEVSKVDYEKYDIDEEQIKDNVNLDKFNLDGRVNPEKVQRHRTYVSYLGKKYPKIGYGANGQALPDELKKDQVKKLMDNITSKGDLWTIEYKADVEKHKIVAFMDPTCPHCKDFHAEVNEYTKHGVSVYFMFYPRTMAKGLKDSDVKQTIGLTNDIWYNKDRKQAIADVYDGYRVQDTKLSENEVKIQNPVFEHYLIGELLDIEGTPTILLDNGEVFSGYLPYKTMLRKIYGM